MENASACITEAYTESCHLPVARRTSLPTIVIPGVHPDFDGSKRNFWNAIKNRISGLVGYVSFLFTPEDSEETIMDARMNQAGSVDLLSARPRVDPKAMFWIMASILTALLLARFCQ